MIGFVVSAIVSTVVSTVLSTGLVVATTVVVNVAVAIVQTGYNLARVRRLLFPSVPLPEEKVLLLKEA